MASRANEGFLGCRDVTVGGPPKGALETVAVAPERITLSGFTFDPDTAESILVHVYVDDAAVALSAGHLPTRPGQDLPRLRR